jgi:hypothetical protein
MHSKITSKNNLRSYHQEVLGLYPKLEQDPLRLQTLCLLLCWILRPHHQNIHYIGIEGVLILLLGIAGIHSLTDMAVQFIETAVLQMLKTIAIHNQ